MRSSDHGDQRRRGYLQTLFDKPSGNPYARVQEPEAADDQPPQAADSNRVTSQRERPEKRPPPYPRGVACSHVHQRVSLEPFFDKPSGNPCARAQTPDDAASGPYNSALSERPARDNAVSRDRKALENPDAHIDGEGNFQALTTDSQSRSRTSVVTRPIAVSIVPEQLVKPRRQGKRYADLEIEGAARALQITLWRNRHTLFPEEVISTPLKIVDPALAINCLGMSFDVFDSLGQYSDRNGQFEVAGIIDPPSRQVRISNQFRPHIQNFTAAHELGHAVLHEGTALHRDRAVDGSGSNGRRDWKETEADRFAAAFLIPAKPLCQQFANRFHTTRVILNEDTAFGITSQNQDSVRASIRKLRDWSRMIAGASYYQDQHFTSLAEEFNVSVDAMAIRLETLDLIGL